MAELGLNVECVSTNQRGTGAGRCTLFSSTLTSSLFSFCLALRNDDWWWQSSVLHQECLAPRALSFFNWSPFLSRSNLSNFYRSGPLAAYICQRQRAWVIRSKSQKVRSSPPPFVYFNSSVYVLFPSLCPPSVSPNRMTHGASSIPLPSLRPWATCCALDMDDRRRRACQTSGSPCSVWSLEPPATPCSSAMQPHSSSLWTHPGGNTKKRWGSGWFLVT